MNIKIIYALVFMGANSIHGALTHVHETSIGLRTHCHTDIMSLCAILRQCTAQLQYYQSMRIMTSAHNVCVHCACTHATRTRETFETLQEIVRTCELYFFALEIVIHSVVQVLEGCHCLYEFFYGDIITLIDQSQKIKPLQAMHKISPYRNYLLLH